jgi:predicted ATPase
MITYLEALGFKSLTDFKVSFTRGLNVLIGPNGAGKSSICQAIGLLSSLAQDDMVEYILSLGGAGAIFTMHTAASDAPYKPPRELEILCHGEVEITGDENFHLRYSYGTGLRHTEDGVKLFKEHVHIKRQSEIGSWRTIIRASREEGNVAKIAIRNPALVGPVAFKALKKQKDFELDLPSNAESLLPILSVYYVCHLVREDLGYLRAWNIDPHLAKRSADILEQLVMLPNGRRLAGAIYSLEKLNPEQFSELNAILSESIPRFEELNSEISQDGLTRTFSITDSDGVKCRAPSLPDGVVKIIALAVGILSRNKDSAIIEEPENYLHPWASQWLIRYLRTYFAQGSCILTTHSETVLNQVHPQEIVIVTNDTGNTEAFRLHNKSALTKVIQDSGFGCGYHYVTGALGGVPE